MNAKKIMGAVLVALLAAALFVGAGAAADLSTMDGKTVFVYQKNSTLVGSTWNNGANSITFGADGVLSGNNIVEGAYVNGENTIYVKYPTAAISAVATKATEKYAVIGETLFTDATSVTITAVSPAAGVGVGEIFVTLPDGVVKRGSELFSGATVSGNPEDGELIITITDTTVIENLASGTYKLQAGFAVGTDDNDLIDYTPDNYRVAKDVYSLTVAGEADLSISANVDSVIVGNPVVVTIKGMPGVQYTIGGDFVLVSNGSVLWDDVGKKITMPNNGVAVIYMEADSADDKEITVSLGETEASVTIDVVEGSITVEAEKESYYIGNKVTIIGTTTAGNELYAYIAGTNIDFQELNKTSGSNQVTVKNGEIKFEVEGSVFKNIDAGTYTVYIAKVDGKTSVDQIGDVYGTASLVLKQPFISVTDAPSVAVQGSSYTVKGTAEAATGVYAYIFGTNFFAANNTNDETFSSIKVEKNEFTIKVAGSATKNMSAGQYFMVVQHPMYDTFFNIAANGSKIQLNETGSALEGGAVLFDVNDRQRANAAEALCQALDTENIDDMYVKLSFVVAAPSSVINPIPETVAQGEKLTISGSTNTGKGTIVTVEMLSTAFAAVPKSTVGSASFISLVTKTDENGNWEVTFDTTGLNVDEYTVSAAVEQLGTATAKINVVEAAPENPEQPENPVTPEQPEQPEQPTEPTTPGFGALAALAGLGAVAVLLLRRE